jgi:hypothetical protein
MHKKHAAERGSSRFTSMAVVFAVLAVAALAAGTQMVQPELTEDQFLEEIENKLNHARG